MDEKYYDIGKLKDDPWRLYDLTMKFLSFIPCPDCSDDTAEIWTVLKKVRDSLMINLPPVVVIDFRDPDDPDTWGDFPPSRLGFNS